VTYAELRKFAGPGVFPGSTEHDQIMVELPLHEVLARIDPKYLARRPQRKIVVPDSVAAVFGSLVFLLTYYALRQL